VASRRISLDQDSPVAANHTMNHDLRGWKWTCAAGFAPLVAGLLILATTWWSILNSAAPWSLGISRLNFSFDQIRSVGSSAASLLEALASVGAVNITATAIAVIVVSRFALRRGEAWAWWFLFFCLVWVGFHDAWAATRFFLRTREPLLVLPYSFCTLMLIGLYKSRSAARSRERKKA